MLDGQYRYDTWGERKQRKDVVHGQIENYGYSKASRLKQAKLATGAKLRRFFAFHAGDPYARAD